MFGIYSKVKRFNMGQCSEKMNYTNPKRNTSIDGLRGISIILVLVDHFLYYSDKAILNPLISFFINSKNGVDLFFIISGFLITNILLKEYLNVGCINIASFYIKRAFRILPALYFLIFVYFILSILNLINVPYSNILSSILLVTQFNRVHWEFFHFWSLSVENIFYILFPILLNKYQLFDYHNIFYYSIIFVSFLPFFRYLLYTQTNLSVFNIFFRCEGLIFGVLIALRSHYEFPKYFNKKLLLVFIFITSFLIIYKIFQPFKNIIILDFILKQYLTIFIVFLLAILFYLVKDLKKGFIFSILNNSILTFVGMISYSIYLWQQIFFSKSEIFHFENNIYRFLCIFLISLFSYYFIESPFIKFKKGLK
jgi:peptidoglycan/LPS O-acetylase OafA/YrhL